LAEFVTWAGRGGLFPDLSYLWWDLRPRPDYGTLELRIADVQTRPAETGAVAAVWQSLVAALAVRYRRGEPLPVYDTQMLNENRWRAMRDGLDGELVDLESGASVRARDRIGTLLGELEPFADELGCGEQLAHAWTLQAENGAARQRTITARQGLRGLLEWLADETEPRSVFSAESPDLAPQPLAAPPALAAASTR